VKDCCRIAKISPFAPLAGPKGVSPPFFLFVISGPFEGTTTATGLKTLLS